MSLPRGATRAAPKPAAAFPLSLLLSCHAAVGAGRRHGRPAGREGGGEALFFALVTRSAAGRQAIPRAAAWFCLGGCCGCGGAGWCPRSCRGRWLGSLARGPDGRIQCSWARSSADRICLNSWQLVRWRQVVVAVAAVGWGLCRCCGVALSPLPPLPSRPYASLTPRVTRAATPPP